MIEGIGIKMAIQTDAEYLEELNTELALLNTAIKNIIQTGDAYTVDTGSSKRIFEADLEKWKKIRNGIRLEIKALDPDTNNSVVLGASW